MLHMYLTSTEVRQRYYDAESLQQLLQETNVTYVFDYLCEIGLHCVYQTLGYMAKHISKYWWIMLEQTT